MAATLAQNESHKQNSTYYQQLRQHGKKGHHGDKEKIILCYSKNGMEWRILDSYANPPLSLGFA